MENGGSEQAGEGVEKSDTEITSDKQNRLDSLITDQFNTKLDCTDLKVARYKTTLPENMVQVNKSSNLYESDSLL